MKKNNTIKIFFPNKCIEELVNERNKKMYLKI